MVTESFNKFPELLNRIDSASLELLDTNLAEAAKLTDYSYVGVIATLVTADVISTRFGITFTAEEIIALGIQERRELEKSLLKLTAKTASQKSRKVNPKSMAFLKDDSQDIFSHELAHINRHNEFVEFSLSEVKMSYYLSVNPFQKIDISFRTRMPKHTERLSPLQIIFVKLAPTGPSQSDYFSVLEMFKAGDKDDIVNASPQIFEELGRKRKSQERAIVENKLRAIVKSHQLSR
jgi:hypothetical protein